EDEMSRASVSGTLNKIEEDAEDAEDHGDVESLSGFAADESKRYSSYLGQFFRRTHSAIVLQQALDSVANQPITTLFQSKESQIVLRICDGRA
ncbi:hypothetical protein PCASD_26491, partial [Puccinia coronata f. sp. avenae]